MPQTQTRPLDDPKMWRRLLGRTHPDAGGDHELFIWVGSVRDVVYRNLPSLHAGVSPEPSDHPSRRREASTPYPPPTDDKPRIPYPTWADFEKITQTALMHAALTVGATGAPYDRVLSLLADCRPLDHLAHEQKRGASYKRLAAIAHAWGMTKDERVSWYRVAESIPLSDRHAGHILSRIKRGTA